MFTEKDAQKYIDILNQFAQATRDLHELERKYPKTKSSPEAVLSLTPKAVKEEMQKAITNFEDSLAKVME